MATYMNSEIVRKRITENAVDELCSVDGGHPWAGLFTPWKEMDE
jgi:hypothetical protein